MKNIAEPVSAFRIVPGPVVVAVGAKPAPKPSAAARWRTPAIAAAVIVVVAVGGLAIWDAYFRAAVLPVAFLVNQKVSRLGGALDTP